MGAQAVSNLGLSLSNNLENGNLLHRFGGRNFFDIEPALINSNQEERRQLVIEIPGARTYHV